MDFIEAAGRSEKSGFQKFLSAAEGEEVSIEGAVHSVRNMGEIGFVVLRRREGLIQAVWEKGKTKLPLSSVHQGETDLLSGTLVYGALATGKIKKYQLLLSSIFFSDILFVYIAFKLNMPPEPTN